MKTTRLFSVLMALCLSLGVYAVDWSTIAFLGDGAGGGKYTDKYKVEAVNGLNTVNIQKPGWAAEDGIYVTVPAGISNVSVASSIDGAGAVLYLSAFTAQETEVTITHGLGTLTFHVYYADGTAGGAGGGVEYDVNFALASNGASATASSGNAAEAIDGNDGSRWESVQEDSQWFLLDLGQVRTFNTVQIRWEGAYGSSFIIEYSTDDTTWSNFATITDQTLAGFPYEQLLEVPEAVTAQYVRFTGTKRGTQYGYSFFEFRVLNASTSVLTSLTAKAASELVKLGEEVAITITAKDQNGKTMDGVAVEYTVAPEDAGTVVDGKYQPAKAGLATITAKSGEIAAAPISIFTYEGENVALSESITNSKVIAQSPFEPSGTDAFHAVDANEGSAWQGCPTNTTTNDEAARTYDSWFVLDLGAFYNVNLVTITFEGACSQEYHLDFSADNTNWNLAYDYKGNAGVNGHTDMLYGDNLKNNTSVRFVRFYSTKAATEWGMKIFDMKVFATPGAAPADDEKPVMVSASLVSNTFNSAVIAVEATDNNAVAKYNVKDEANSFSGSFAPVDGKITVTGLQPETTYNLVITALDLVGNESEESKTVQVITPVHLYEPNVAATVPTVDAAWVKAVYSDTYGVTYLGFGEWGGGYAMADKAIGADNYKMLTTDKGGTWLGLTFEGEHAVNATGMKYWHLDVWAENDGVIGVYPIWGGSEYSKTVTVKGQQWNSIELVLTTDYPNIDNWSNIYQIKFDNTSANNLAVDNIYFYTDPVADEEKPTNVTAELASASYTSITLTCQAEDNSGVVSFDVYNGDTKVGTGGGESGKPVTVTVSNLAAGQAYTLAVEAYDQNGNKADRVSVSASTVAFPASAAAPTAEEANVYAIYSDAYTTIHGPSEYNQTWWQNPTVQYLKLTETDNVLLYTSNGNVDGCFGWPFSATFDLTGYTTLHYDIYPEATGTVEFGITRRPEGTADVKKVFNVTGGQWNHIELDLTGQDLTQVFQLGFWAFSTVKSFILDNVYFEKPAPAGLKGTYIVGGEDADFVSLAEATAAVNALPIEGDVTLLIAADLTETTNSGLVNPTDYTVTIRPATAEMRTITFTATADNAGPSGSIVIGSSNPVAGANEVATKNVVIDGFAEGSDVQNLTIVHKNVAGRLVTYGAASDIIIQNIISRHDDASSGTRYGVQFRGNTGKPENITVRGNYFDGKHTTQVINFSNGISANIENNTFKLSGLASGQLAYGVHGYTVTGTVNVRGNKFIDVTTADVPTNGIVAVSVQGGTWIVENNYFSGMDYLNTDASATARMYYVRTIVPNTVIRHNTFYIPELTNKPANTTNTVAAIESAGSGTSIVENNIFVSVESTAQHGFFFGNTNTYKNNVFYMNANNEKAYILGTQTWSNFSAATDNIWAEVSFTDAAKGDLSLAAANEALLVPAIADVTTDINGTARGTEKVYAGAFEFVAPAGPTEMTLTPAEGTIVRGDMAPFIASVAFDVEGEYEVTWEVIDMMGNDVTEGATGLQIFYEDYDIIIRVSNDYVGNMLMVMATYGDLFAKGTYTIGEAAVVGPEGLSVYAESALEIESLGTLQLLAGFYPENATANVIWSSSDETLATVDQNGLVTSLYTATDKDTTVRIFAMAEGFEGVEGYADITLLKAEIPSSLENVNVELKATKVLRNGQVIIIRDEEEYTILGTKIQ